MRKKNLRNGLALMALLVVMSFGAISHAGLAEMGPIDPLDHTPLWYKDTSGLQLGPCLNPRYCFFDPVVRGNAWSMQTGYGMEVFYFMAETAVPATVTTATGVSGVITIGLESTYASTAPQDGQQMIFARLRIRLDGLPVRGPYTVVHPYGQKAFVAADLITVTDPKTGVTTYSINFTDDVPLAVGDFTGVLTGYIGPFLTAVQPAPPAGFVGRINALQTVTGSPFGTNYILITGPTGAVISTGKKPNILRISRFNLQGQIATNVGLRVQSAIYTKRALGGGSIKVTATSAPGKILSVSGTGFLTTQMTENALKPGTYNATVSFTRTAVIKPFTVTNESDVPATSFQVNPVDSIKITTATYTAATGALQVTASSGDKQTPPSSLSILDQNGNLVGVIVGGSGTVNVTLATAPTKITVTSSLGGSQSKKVLLQ